MPKALHEALLRSFSKKGRKGGALKGKNLNNAVYGTMTNILKKKFEGKGKK